MLSFLLANGKHWRSASWSSTGVAKIYLHRHTLLKTIGVHTWSRGRVEEWRRESMWLCCWHWQEAPAESTEGQVFMQWPHPCHLERSGQSTWATDSFYHHWGREHTSGVPSSTVEVAMKDAVRTLVRHFNSQYAWLQSISFHSIPRDLDSSEINYTIRWQQETDDHSYRFGCANRSRSAKLTYGELANGDVPSGC
jgi:hypothetical protein